MTIGGGLACRQYGGLSADPAAAEASFNIAKTDLVTETIQNGVNVSGSQGRLGNIDFPHPFGVQGSSIRSVHNNAILTGLIGRIPPSLG